MWSHSTLGLGHGDEIGAEEDAGDVLHREDAPRERRFLRRFGGRKIGRAHFQHGLAGQEFQRRGVRGGFGLDEHGSVPPSVQSDMRAAPRSQVLERF
jgi:hypothetical protein